MKVNIDIARVYDMHAARLYNICLRILGNEADAEEVMHDTLLKYNSLSKKDEIKDLAKWLSSVSIRKSIDKLRERHRYKDFLSRYAETAEDAHEEELPEDLTVDIIRKALKTLPDHYRLILTLHLFEGYDYQEIAQITGNNENTIRSLYMRGRQKLATAIRQNTP